MPINEPTHNDSAKYTQGFYFLNGKIAESIEGYKPGGYHPVHLGDMFPSRNTPRYRVLQKLGMGESSTVWLARDMEENRWVALKFIVARLTGRNQEIAILKSLSNKPGEHPGADHVVKLLDSFEVDGPNGTHEVIVTHVFAPFYSLQSANFLEKYKRVACYQLLQGLAFIQSHLIIHGNLHFGNIGCQIPHINSLTEAELLREVLPDPVPIAVIPKDPTVQSNSRPKYIVEPVSIVVAEPEIISDDPNFQFVAEIFDFGSAVRLHEKSIDTFPQIPRIIRPPELTFHMLSGGKIKAEWTMASDVWSLACTIHETTFGTSLFHQVDSDEGLISQTIGYLGPLPDCWTLTWNMKSRRDDAESVVGNPNHQWERKCTSGNIDMDPVVDLLRGMMRYEPADRPLPADLLNHPCPSACTLLCTVASDANVQAFKLILGEGLPTYIDSAPKLETVSVEKGMVALVLNVIASYFSGHPKEPTFKFSSTADGNKAFDERQWPWHSVLRAEHHTEGFATVWLTVATKLDSLSIVFYEVT